MDVDYHAICRHAAGTFALDGQRPFQLGAGDGKRRLRIADLDVVLGFNQGRVALQFGRYFVELRLPAWHTGAKPIRARSAGDADGMN